MLHDWLHLSPLVLWRPNYVTTLKIYIAEMTIDVSEDSNDIMDPEDSREYVQSGSVGEIFWWRVLVPW